MYGSPVGLGVPVLGKETKRTVYPVRVGGKVSLWQGMRVPGARQPVDRREGRERV